MPEPVDIELDPGRYAFSERAIIQVVGTGGDLYLWIGLDNENHSCLGVLQGTGLKKLEKALAERRSARTTKAKDLGRTAETTRGYRQDGRRRG